MYCLDVGLYTPLVLLLVFVGVELMISISIHVKCMFCILRGLGWAHTCNCDVCDRVLVVMEIMVLIVVV